MSRNNTRRGLILISVPKSGTMFLSGYLERITSIPVVFGLSEKIQRSVICTLRNETHPMILDNLTKSSPRPDIMLRRYLLMLKRNRLVGGGAGQVLISDHGFENFLVFLRCPHKARLLAPSDISAKGDDLRLGTVFLYRDISSVAQSFTYFLTSGKSFLLRIDKLSVAAEIVVDLYMPLLAEMTRTWLHQAKDLGILCISYDDLVYRTPETLARICGHGGLSGYGTEKASSDQFKSWTYRSQRPPDGSCFTAEQKAKLADLQASLNQDLKA